MSHKQSGNKQHITRPKFNSSPLKSYRNPIGKACLPSTILQRRTVKLRGKSLGRHLGDGNFMCFFWTPWMILSKSFGRWLFNTTVDGSEIR